MLNAGFQHNLTAPSLRAKVLSVALRLIIATFPFMTLAERYAVSRLVALALALLPPSVLSLSSIAVPSSPTFFVAHAAMVAGAVVGVLINLAVLVSSLGMCQMSMRPPRAIDLAAIAISGSLWIALPAGQWELFSEHSRSLSPLVNEGDRVLVSPPDSSESYCAGDLIFYSIGQTFVSGFVRDGETGDIDACPADLLAGTAKRRAPENKCVDERDNPIDVVRVIHGTCVVGSVERSKISGSARYLVSPNISRFGFEVNAEERASDFLRLEDQ